MELEISRVSLVAELALGLVDRCTDPLDREVFSVPAASRRVDLLAVERVGLGPQVGEVLVAAADGTLVAQRVDIDGRDDDLLSGAGVGLRGAVGRN